MAIEQTLILIKPDGAHRKLTGLVIDRLDASGLEMVGARMVSVSELAQALQSALGEALLPKRFIRGEFHGFRDHRVLAAFAASTS